MDQNYDAIVIGTGQAGPPLTRRLVAAGQRVAIIERKLFGGTCVNTGCIPTKTMVASAYAAQMVAQDACRQAMGHGLKEVSVRVKGPGTGRESAIRALQAIGLEVTSITDVTPVPHNGCRPRKQRRV